MYSKLFLPNSISILINPLGFSAVTQSAKMFFHKGQKDYGKTMRLFWFKDLYIIIYFKLILPNTSPRACHLPESDQVQLLSNSSPAIQDFITDCKSILRLLQLWSSTGQLKSLWVHKALNERWNKKSLGTWTTCYWLPASRHIHRCFVEFQEDVP